MSIFLVLLCGYTVIVEAQIQDIRLSGNGATAASGRVEILYNNIWGTVCNDNFDDAAAIVVCRGLGFNYGGRPVPLNTTGYGQGTGPIWLDNFQCFGDEISLDQCLLSGWNNSDCNHDEDAAVECTLFNYTDGAVRLISPPDLPGSGYVEVFINGSWGAVCDTNWNLQNARVVCRMLLFNVSRSSAGAPIEVESVWNNVTKMFLLDNLDCLGTETNILNCQHSPFNNCDESNRHEYAKVTCVEMVDSPSRAPVPILRCNDEAFTVVFDLQQNTGLQEQDLTLAKNATCDLQKVTGVDDITIRFQFDDCGTVTLTNLSHIIYANELRYEKSSSVQPGSPPMVISHSILLRCEFRRSQNTSNGGDSIRPITEQVTQVAPGDYSTRIQFYQDNTFQTPIQSNPVELVPGEWLYVAVVLETSQTNLKVVIQDCHATPDSNQNNPVFYPLIRDKCPSDPTLSYFPVNSTMFGFRYQAFKFLDYDYVYLHCDVIVCIVSETSGQCDRSCNNPVNGRRRRRHSSYKSYHIRSRPMYFASEIYRGEPSGSSNMTFKDSQLLFVLSILLSLVFNNFVEFN